MIQESKNGKDARMASDTVIAQGRQLQLPPEAAIESLHGERNADFNHHDALESWETFIASFCTCWLAKFYRHSYHRSCLDKTLFTQRQGIIIGILSLLFMFLHQPCIRLLSNLPLFALLVSFWNQFCILFLGIPVLLGTVVLCAFLEDPSRMALVQSTSYPHHNGIHTPRQPSWAASTMPESASNLNSNSNKSSPHMLDDLVALNGLRMGGIEQLDTLQDLDSLGQALEKEASGLKSAISFQQVTAIQFNKQEREIDRTDFARELEPPPKGTIFKKWIKSLHRRATQRPSLLGDQNQGHDILGHVSVRRSLSQKLRHRSSSGSSFGFVGAVRSASVSLASVSAVTRSRRHATRSRCRTDRSSRASVSMPRMSEDSFVAERSQVVDAAITERSLQRRRILEELISTEESYIGDVRFLINVYVTILASLPSSNGLRYSIHRNLTEIVELHEGILGELHRVVPDSEYTQGDIPLSITTSAFQGHSHHHGHRRWKSLDAVPEHTSKMTWLSEVPGVIADPQVAAEVAKIFSKRMSRFFIYEEYGAKYEMMIKDVATANESMPEWESFQRGLEALASTLGPVTGCTDASKKCQTINDLLVKPVQRICKYPLLFAQLLKYTPVFDCPNSYMEIESTLIRLREAAAEINKATDDDHVKTSLEKTWLLQERLVLPRHKLDAAMRNHIRSLGRIHMCGALHICWQAKDITVDGQYMVCLLYQDVLCLAEAGKFDPIYTIMACINLNGAKIEDVDNGRGLQCHSAPFSWKLVFESDYLLYEMIMTACSFQEEKEWRARLSRPWNEDESGREANIFTSLELDMKHLGAVYGKPGTVARRVSIQRATTHAAKSPLCQVVLKNTSITKDGRVDGSGSLTINRSQSLLTNARLPTLAPARGDRARLEALLGDVWSREILPFPGMGTRTRSEHLVRAASSSMMRKLSVASFSSFGKRSSSVHRKNILAEETEFKESCDTANDKCPKDIGSTEDEVAELDTSSKRLKVYEAFRSSPENPKFEVTDTQGTVRKITATALKGSLSLSDEDLEIFGAPFLQSTPLNNLELDPSINAENESIRKVDEKENAETLVESPGDTIRGMTRWPKVGAPRNNGQGHSFRSLFR